MVNKLNIKPYLNQITQLRYSHLSLPDKKFLIFAQGRSGSTLLVSLLNSHENIYCDGEIFNRRQYGKIYFPNRYISCTSKKAAARNKSVYGFKVKIYQLSRDQNYNNYNEILNKLHEDGWMFISLRRSNILKQSLSIQIYEAQGFTHTTDNARINKNKIKVDIRRLVKNMEMRIEFNKKEDEVLSKIPHISINYEEDLVNSENHQEAADKIFKFMGLKKCKVRSDYVKIASDKIEENISNYNELHEFIESAGYGHFFEM